jgi:hypothetical protein
MAGRFSVAVVGSGTDKAGDDGCSVTFISDPGLEWVQFGGVVRNERVATWSRVAGERWGDDSPEGGPEEPNVVVLPGGLVTVPA